MEKSSFALFAIVPPFYIRIDMRMSILNMISASLGFRFTGRLFTDYLEKPISYTENGKIGVFLHNSPTEA